MTYDSPNAKLLQRITREARDRNPGSVIWSAEEGWHNDANDGRE
ncbi:Uncharacterised protein [Mycobacteroides abscessus subsp. abscessus]|nr:hypothetical protein [Mycobacteroides abscessus]SIH25462.1 Uncharacterised protein [Mycobacteroides abscessus subsp. abscessus]